MGFQDILEGSRPHPQIPSNALGKAVEIPFSGFSGVWRRNENRQGVNRLGKTASIDHGASRKNLI
jgi:hypothetical protein